MDMGYETRPIRPSDRDAVERIRAEAGHTLSAHAFTSLYLWRNVMGLSVCMGEDAFFIRYGMRGEDAWFFPCGSPEEAVAFARAAADRPGCSLHYLRQQDVALLEERLPGRFRFEEARGDAEYLYDRAAQVELKGNRYKDLRAKVRRAQRSAAWTVREIGPAQREAARDVIRGWQHFRALTGDGEVAGIGLDSFDELGLRGILLETADGPQAMAYGSLLAPDIFDLHVTKTVRPNLDAYLRWELFRRLPPEVRLIDMEEDLDIPGLRTNKTEAVPVRLEMLWKGVPA